jgi:hypothetical protein
VTCQVHMKNSSGCSGSSSSSASSELLSIVSGGSAWVANSCVTASSSVLIYTVYIMHRHTCCVYVPKHSVDQCASCASQCLMFYCAFAVVALLLNTYILSTADDKHTQCCITVLLSKHVCTLLRCVMMFLLCISVRVNCASLCSMPISF